MQMCPDIPPKTNRSLLRSLQLFFLTVIMLTTAFSCSTFPGIFKPVEKSHIEESESASEITEVSGSDENDIIIGPISEDISSKIITAVDAAVPPFAENEPDEYAEPPLVLHQSDFKEKQTQQAVQSENNPTSIDSSEAAADSEIKPSEVPEVLPGALKAAQLTASAVSASEPPVGAAFQKTSQETAAAAQSSESAALKTTPAEETCQPIILQVEAVSGELAVFELPGEGWLFNGFTESDTDEDKIRYNGRDFLNDNTVFSFFCYRECVAELEFSLSDYRADSVEKALVSITVVDNVQSIDPAETKAEIADAAETADTQINISNEDFTPAIRAEQPQIAPVIPENTKDLLEYCKTMAEDGNPEAAVELIESRMPDFDFLELDSVYFFLAKQYESVSGLRDIRKSIDYYKKIVDEFPISLYWEDSRERINYLERRYIYIR